MTSISPSASDLDGADDPVPAFRCRVSPTGAWVFRCTCGQEHAHGAGEGHRASHCDRHRATGYNLLVPTPCEVVA